MGIFVTPAYYDVSLSIMVGHSLNLLSYGKFKESVRPARRCIRCSSAEGFGTVNIGMHKQDTLQLSVAQIRAG
jgi:hypothetical protein